MQHIVRPPGVAYLQKGTHASCSGNFDSAAAGAGGERRRRGEEADDVEVQQQRHQWRPHAHVHCHAGSFLPGHRCRPAGHKGVKPVLCSLAQLSDRASPRKHLRMPFVDAVCGCWLHPRRAHATAPGLGTRRRALSQKDACELAVRHEYIVQVDLDGPALPANREKRLTGAGLASASAAPRLTAACSGLQPPCMPTKLTTSYISCFHRLEVSRYCACTPAA